MLKVAQEIVTMKTAVKINMEQNSNYVAFDDLSVIFIYLLIYF